MEFHLFLPQMRPMYEAMVVSTWLALIAGPGRAAKAIRSSVPAGRPAWAWTRWIVRPAACTRAAVAG